MEYNPEDLTKASLEILRSIREDTDRRRTEREVYQLQSMAREPITPEENEEFSDLHAQTVLFRDLILSTRYTWEEALVASRAAMEATRTQRKRYTELLNKMPGPLPTGGYDEPA